MSEPLQAWTYCPTCGDPILPYQGAWWADEPTVRYCNQRCQIGALDE